MPKRYPKEFRRALCVRLVAGENMWEQTPQRGQFRRVRADRSLDRSCSSSVSPVAELGEPLGQFLDPRSG